MARARPGSFVVGGSGVAAAAAAGGGGGGGGGGGYCSSAGACPPMHLLYSKMTKKHGGVLGPPMSDLGVLLLWSWLSMFSVVLCQVLVC